MPVFYILSAMVFGCVGYYEWVHRNDPPTPPPQPNLVTTAPDGTKLYHFHTDGHDVYFSRAGAEHEETHMAGKIVHHETVAAPNAQ